MVAWRLRGVGLGVGGCRKEEEEEERREGGGGVKRMQMSCLERLLGIRSGSMG